MKLQWFNRHITSKRLRVTAPGRLLPGTNDRKRPKGHFTRASQMHTCASQLLTTGVASIDWIAEQMDHTNGNMIRQHYGTWINEDAPDVVGMLQLALKLSPITIQH